MERKPPRHSDGHSSSRAAPRGPKRPRGEGDARPARREGSENRFRERGDDRFESRGRPGGGQGGRQWNDQRGPRDDGDRPRRPPARAQWQEGGESQGRFDRNDRQDAGSRGGFSRPDRPRNDRPRFERNDRFDDRRPRRDDQQPAIDDDAGNRMDYEPRRPNNRFDDRRPRKATFEGGGRFGDNGSADRARDPGRRFKGDGYKQGGFKDGGYRDSGFKDGETPRRGPSQRDGFDNARKDTDKPRKERYQVWNKELPTRDEPRSDRSTLKLSGKGDVIERKIYGVNACLSFFLQRPNDIIRAYFTEAVARQHFGDLMKFLAQEKLAYHLVPVDDMERITESTHHEGVCLLVRDQPAESFFHWMETNPTEATQAQCILALEDLGNPHNVGAILRVAAHFGVKAVVVKDSSLARSGAAMRTAEGGAEHVKLLEAEDFERMLAACRREGYSVVATSSHKGASLFEQTLPARVVILLGQETKGLSGALQDSSDLQVRIPGTKQVESLNVSVATGILLAEYWRHHGI